MSKDKGFIAIMMAVLGATICLGLENNCTRQIANRDPMEIVTIKGFGSGLGALLIAIFVGDQFPFIPTHRNYTFSWLRGLWSEHLLLYLCPTHYWGCKGQYLLRPCTLYRRIDVYFDIRRTYNHDIHYSIGCWLLDSSKVNSN